MFNFWHNLTHAIVLLIGVGACTASHQVEAIGAPGESSCVAYWLAYDFGHVVEVYRNTGDGPVHVLDIPLADAGGGDRTFSAVTVLDLDGDGLRDVAIRDAYGGAALLSEPLSVTLIYGAAGAFEDRVQHRPMWPGETPGGGGLLAFGDWDGDGLSDLGVQYDAGVIAGATRSVFEGDCSTGVRVGDVDGDGTDDTACVTETGMSVRLGGAATGRLRDFPFEVPVRTQISSADSSNDARAELIVGTEDGWTLIDLVRGARVSLPADLRAIRWVGDVDNDGATDFVAGQDDAIYLWRGTPDGPRRDTSPFWRGDSPSVAPAGDANCDGYDDVVVMERVDGSAWRSLYPGGPGGIAGTALWRVPARRQALTPIFD